ncbi:hypothetical protein SDC9_202573 [bioreactor metagenome]|uniref:Uncharacterized protein n=1 Tax=bioreactor metagenome TaxID=1076179 RepID=A0A645ITZ5_9ZZZZ
MKGFVQGNAQDGKGQFGQARSAAIGFNLVYHVLNINPPEFLEFNGA